VYYVKRQDINFKLLGRAMYYVKMLQQLHKPQLVCNKKKKLSESDVNIVSKMCFCLGKITSYAS